MRTGYPTALGGGPYQAIPQAGASWQPEGKSARHPHEYIRGGTAKLLNLFHPHTGRVEALPVGQATNAILHPWLKERLTEILSRLPAIPLEAREQPGRRFSDWGYSEEAEAEREWPLVRLLLVWDNLAVVC